MQSWVEQEGTWEIDLNQAGVLVAGSLPGWPPGTQPGGIATLDIGDSEHTVQIDVTDSPPNTAGLGVVARYVDNDNYWFAMIYHNGFSDYGLYAGKVVGGSVVDSPYTLVVNDTSISQTPPWTVKIAVDGADGWEVTVDGTQYGSTPTDSSLNTATLVGLFEFNTSVDNLDNFIAVSPGLTLSDNFNRSDNPSLGSPPETILKVYTIDTVLKNVAVSIVNNQIDAKIDIGSELSSLDNIINFEIYSGTPSWHVIDPNTLYFSATTISSNISPTTFQGGTHAGTEEVDRCGTNHIPNVKIISANQMSVNGAGTVTISDANLIGGGTGTNGDFRYSTIRIHFKSTRLVSLQNGKLYIYNTSITDPGLDMDIAAYVIGNDMTNWQTINSYSSIGDDMVDEEFQSDFIGGKINGVIDLLGRGPAMDHYYNIILSASPESTDAKTASIGVYLEYF